MIAGNRLATRTKIGYSTFNCGESIVYNLFYTYFLLFMTNFAGVEPAVPYALVDDSKPIFL